MQNLFSLENTEFYPLGVYLCHDGLRVATVFPECSEKDRDRGIIIYDKQHPNGLQVAFTNKHKVGNVYAMLLKGYHNKEFSYLFYDGAERIPDAYARRLECITKDNQKETQLRCLYKEERYDWKGDCGCKIAPSECFMYLLHPRGFTKHSSSGVRHRGTFLGITEKYDYLKKIGATSILLMPSYEFDSSLQKKTSLPLSMEQTVNAAKEPLITNNAKNERQNYWGYADGFYYMPKRSYSAGNDAVSEFKNMVYFFHNKGMEVLMQFFFPEDYDAAWITDILKFWVVNYHIDGFQLIGRNIPMHIICREPLLAETKLLSDKNTSLRHPQTKQDMRISYDYFMDESFMYDIRKFLKGDACMLEPFLQHMRNVPEELNKIHYIAKWDGFRLMDLVSYDSKHNEDNGEDNRDGTDFNFSWNCGVEGRTKKKQVLNLRVRQIKNALTMLLLTPGIPMLYSGDEFGQTQNGNNNPYCQDNSISWINWKNANDSNEIFAHFLQMMQLRALYLQQRDDNSYLGVDTNGNGFPDISFHGKDAWKPDIYTNSRCAGILVCDSVFLYIAVNMHWEAKTLGVPKIPRGYHWSLLLFTNNEAATPKAYGFIDLRTCQQLLIPPRTIMIYCARKRSDS